MEKSVPVLVVTMYFDVVASGFRELLVLDLSVVDIVVVDVVVGEDVHLFYGVERRKVFASAVEPQT